MVIAANPLLAFLQTTAKCVCVPVVRCAMVNGMQMYSFVRNESHKIKTVRRNESLRTFSLFYYFLFFSNFYVLHI